MMEAIRSSETSALIRSTVRNIPEDGIVLDCRFHSSTWLLYCVINTW
jgi:hypothetical protein